VMMSRHRGAPSAPCVGAANLVSLPEIMEPALMECIEREVLAQAERADAAELALHRERVRNACLQTLAHLRLTSRDRVSSVDVVRSVLLWSTAMRMQRAFSIWRTMSLVSLGNAWEDLDHLQDQNQREKIVALEYDNLLLRRNAFKAARHTKVAIAVSSLAGTLYTTQRVSLALAWGRWCSIDPSSIRLSMDAVIGDVQPETTCRPTLPRKDSTGSVMSLSHDTELLWPPLQPKSKSVSSGTSHGSRSSIAPNRHQQSGGTSSRTLR